MPPVGLRNKDWSGTTEPLGYGQADRERSSRKGRRAKKRRQERAEAERKAYAVPGASERLQRTLEDPKRLKARQKAAEMILDVLCEKMIELGLGASSSLFDQELRAAESWLRLRANIPMSEPCVGTAPPDGPPW
ncbi:hypothetical protein [Singulisphaera sp. PoT]|uniref:hypothetical protein n=1 Tax=Singulisphaera sp. PoT TaxID=3411797 RepID=UPI003BF4EF6A